MAKDSLHERLSAAEAVKPGSERAFGLVFSVLFVLIALAPLRHGLPPRSWAAGVAVLFLVVAFAMPRLLRPLNLLWFQFGLLLNKVVSPMVLGILYYATVVPVGLMLKALGKDPLRLKLERQQDSYWIMREPIAPETMRRQF